MRARVKTRLRATLPPPLPPPPPTSPSTSPCLFIVSILKAWSAPGGEVPPPTSLSTLRGPRPINKAFFPPFNRRRRFSDKTRHGSHSYAGAAKPPTAASFIVARSPPTSHRRATPFVTQLPRTHAHPQHNSGARTRTHPISARRTPTELFYVLLLFPSLLRERVHSGRHVTTNDE